MKSLVHDCYHCNNKTLCEVVHTSEAEELWLDGRIWSQSDTGFWEDGGWLTEHIPYTYYVIQCRICNHLSILRGYIDESGKPIELTQKYPQIKNHLEIIPSAIRDTYLEAARIRTRAPHGYVALIRKALELICIERNAVGQNLFQNLNDLANKGVLPSDLSEIATLLRKTGNEAVHASGRRISVLDTEVIDQLFRAIVDYLFILPARMEELKRSLKHDQEPPDDLDDIPF